MINQTRCSLVLGMGMALLIGSAAVQAQQIGAKAQNKGGGKNLPARDVLDQRERGPERTDQPRTTRPGTSATDIAAAADADGSGFYRATDVIGMTIQVEGDTKVGVVKDIVLDSVTNEVAYFLVDSATVLKTDGYLVVPYAAVRGPIFVDGRPAQYIRLNYGIDRLRRAPTLTRAGLRTLRGNDFFFGVNKFFGIERTRRGFRPGDRDRDGRDRDGRARDRDGRDRDGDRPRNRDGDTDRPRRPGDRGDNPKARPRGDRDNDRPQTRPSDTKRPDRDTPKTKPTVRPDVRPDKVNPKAKRPQVERPKVGVPKADNRPKQPKKSSVNLPKEVNPKNIKKGVKGLLDPK